MTGEYPVILDGEERGTLKVSTQGIKFIFDSFCPDTDKLIRLSVYGDSGEGYLGVMQPDKGGMRLHREMSRSSLTSFPKEIKYAGKAGEKRAHSMVKSKTMPTSTPSSTKMEDDTYWRQDTLGLLWAKENDQTLCAVPKRLGIACYGEELPGRLIEGIQYRIFKVKIGNNTFKYSASSEIY